MLLGHDEGNGAGVTPIPCRYRLDDPNDVAATVRAGAGPR